MWEVLSNSFGAIMLFIWLIIVPILMGLPFAGLGSEDRKHLRTAWISGYMVMWAVFQVISVIVIITTGEFVHIVYAYVITSAVLCIVGLCIAYFKRSTFEFEKIRLFGGEKHIYTINFIFYALSMAIILYQVFMCVTHAFADGDDAYYIPISATTVATGNLYTVIPYDGYVTTLDMRHALAPFPVWIAFLSQISGIHATIIAHSILNGVLILVAYSIYYRIGQLLFKKDKSGVPVFMLLVSILFLYGNYSFYTIETFLLTRTAQGKSVLGNIIIPFIMLCILQMGQEFTSDEQRADEHKRPFRESDKRKILLGILTITATMAGWLCSTISVALCGALLMIGGFIISVTYKNYKALAYAAGCCIPSAFFLLFYLVVS